jgi:hypothetical protein
VGLDTIAALLNTSVFPPFPIYFCMYCMKHVFPAHMNASTEHTWSGSVVEGTAVHHQARDEGVRQRSEFPTRLPQIANKNVMNTSIMT